ncbi:UNVERIFIED_CONTAM: hypothetical protein K2H54_035988 [Gekko kuhli]
MDQYPLSDDGSLHSEMQLHEFSGNPALDCSDSLSQELCPNVRDMIYSGLSNLDVDPSLSATNMNSDSLEDNLDTLSLYSVKDSDPAKLLDECETDSQPLLHNLFTTECMLVCFCGENLNMRMADLKDMLGVMPEDCGQFGVLRRIEGGG